MQNHDFEHRKSDEFLEGSVDDFIDFVFLFFLFQELWNIDVYEFLFQGKLSILKQIQAVSVRKQLGEKKVFRIKRYVIIINFQLKF